MRLGTPARIWRCVGEGTSTNIQSTQHTHINKLLWLEIGRSPIYRRRKENCVAVASLLNPNRPKQCRRYVEAWAEEGKTINASSTLVVRSVIPPLPTIAWLRAGIRCSLSFHLWVICVSLWSGIPYSESWNRICCIVGFMLCELLLGLIDLNCRGLNLLGCRCYYCCCCCSLYLRSFASSSLWNENKFQLNATDLTELWFIS